MTHGFRLLTNGPRMPLLAVLATFAVALAPLSASPAFAENFRPRPVGSAPLATPPSVTGPTPGTTEPQQGLTSGTATISGSGFGHGVGLSQYGAYAMAKAGATAEQILSHYYTGTALTPVEDAVQVKINVVHLANSLTLEPRAADTTATGQSLVIAAADGTTLTLKRGDATRVTMSDGMLKLVTTRAAGSTGTGPNTLSTKEFGVTWTGTKQLPGPATVVSVSSTKTSGLKNRAYRWGRLSVKPLNGAIEALATMDLHDEYLLGIDEVPSSWPSASLISQAIAARTYAIYSLARPVSGCGGCQLWDDTRSQNYVGWAKEGQRVGNVNYGAKWIAAVRASQIDATHSQVVTYQGTPIQAVYSSSTGGRTRSAVDVWGTDVPYLVGVEDPWSLDNSINPAFAAWKRSTSITSLRRQFGLPDLVSITVTARDAAGAATRVTAISSTRQSITVSGATFRSRLGLPSDWIGTVTLTG